MCSICKPETLPACGGHGDLLRLSTCATTDGFKTPSVAANGSSTCYCNPARLHEATATLSNGSACANAGAHVLGTFSLDHVCVRYPTKRNAVPQLWARHGACRASLYGYSEFKLNYLKLTTIGSKYERNDQFRGCQRRRLGLALRFSSGNFYHQAFFAAAAHQALAHEARSASDAVFVPIGTGRPEATPDKLWEYTLRGLSAVPMAQLLNETRTLFAAPCTCFERLVAATHGMQLGGVSTSRAALAAFRRSSAIHAAMLLKLAFPRPRGAKDMLFIMRHTTRRVITNEQEVLDQALAEQPRLRAVAFETLPLSEQLVMVAGASVLIGVHGQAIAGYVVHLPADSWRTACLEIRPLPSRLSFSWTHIVPNLARVVGVYHQYLDTPHSPGCPVDNLLQRECQTDACRAAVHKGLRSHATGSVLQCNVTIRPTKLLPLIQKVAKHTALQAQR